MEEKLHYKGWGAGSHWWSWWGAWGNPRVTHPLNENVSSVIQKVSQHA